MRIGSRYLAVLAGLVCTVTSSTGVAAAAPTPPPTSVAGNDAASDRPDVRGYTASDLQTAAAGYAARGYQMSDVSSFPLNDGSLRFNAVGQRTPQTRPWVVGKTDLEVENKDDELQKQGFHELVYNEGPAHNGDNRFNAIWAKGTDSYGTVNYHLPGAEVEQCIRRDAQDAKDLGYTMAELSSTYLSDGTTDVTIRWQHRSTPATWVAGWTVGDFQTEDARLRAAGWRLLSVSPRMLPGDQLRLDAVWQHQPGYQSWVVAYTSADFSTVFAQQQAAGHVLRSLTGFALSGNQVRYNGVWG